MGFEKDIFNDERMYPTIKRILRKDVINIDEMVEFLTTCGTPRRVSRICFSFTYYLAEI
jgi:hypothetical protein